jgi:hypothetical protein
MKIRIWEAIYPFTSNDSINECPYLQQRKVNMFCKSLNTIPMNLTLVNACTLENNFCISHRERGKLKEIWSCGGSNLGFVTKIHQFFKIVLISPLILIICAYNSVRCRKHLSKSCQFCME